MGTSVPTASDTAVNLADVLPSCLHAMGVTGMSAALEFNAAASRGPRIALPPCRSAIVVLVDGLGASALAARGGYARFLARETRKIRSGFPTTTAAALSSLTTGTSPGTHGVVGFSGWVPERESVANFLSGWGTEVPDGWLRAETLFSRAGAAGVDVAAVGPARYHSSGFTANVLAGARYIDGDAIPARVDAALDVVRGDGQQLVYLYVPELDSIAHKRGWQHDRWTATLEELDTALARLHEQVPADVGIVITADHGILDVPDHANIAVDPALLEDVVAFAGDPRCRQLTLTLSADPVVVRDAWRARYGKRATVATRDEAIAAGWFGVTTPKTTARIGDVLVVARSSWAFNDDRGLRPGEAPKRMIGQHGAMTDDETFVLLRLAGAFTRTS